MLPSPAQPDPQPTRHALLVAWGHFAHELDLVAPFLTIPIPQKTVHQPPAAKLLTLVLGLLSGSEYLPDLSLGPAPLSRDPVVAAAWGLPTLASASAVRRTLAACTPTTLLVLQQIVDQLTAPFLHRALAALHAQQLPIQLDGDLTGRPVSSASHSYPGAAFGYMDGEIHLGYQLAAVCLQTPQYGRWWLAGPHHPGDTVSSACLRDRLNAAEARLGSAVGMQVQALLTLFAANFVAWTRDWLAERVLVETASAARALSRPKQGVRVAANSLAVVAHNGNAVGGRFSSLRGLPGTVIYLHGSPTPEVGGTRFLSTPDRSADYCIAIDNITPSLHRLTAVDDHRGSGDEGSRLRT